MAAYYIWKTNGGCFFIKKISLYIYFFCSDERQSIFCRLQWWCQENISIRTHPVYALRYTDGNSFAQRLQDTTAQCCQKKFNLRLPISTKNPQWQMMNKNNHSRCFSWLCYLWINSNEKSLLNKKHLKYFSGSFYMDINLVFNFFLHFSWH